MKSIIAIAACILAFANFTLAASKQCYMEPFPSMLAQNIVNEHRCGLNNPHIINWACEPVRGLVPDAVWLEYQLSRFEKEEVEVQQSYQEEGEQTPTYNILEARPSANPFPGKHAPFAGFEPAGLAAMAVGALSFGQNIGKVTLQ